MLRVHNSLTSRAEKRLLLWLCRCLPRWVTPDMLTLVGLIGAGMAFAGFWFANTHLVWLWLAIAGLIINWLGDSLDGTLARHLNAERAKYGFFVDHMTDTFAMALIGVGIGVSPFAHLTSALVVLIAYYLMTILSLITCVTTNIFRISFNGLGPTEVRLAVIACSFAVIMWPIPRFAWGGMQVTLYDIVVLSAAALMFIQGTARAIVTAQELAAADPRARQ